MGYARKQKGTVSYLTNSMLICDLSDISFAVIVCIFASFCLSLCSGTDISATLTV